jgi:hypothetical protein
MASSKAKTTKGKGEQMRSSRNRFFWPAVTVLAALSLFFGASLAYADTLSPDGDTAKNGNNITYLDTASPGAEACSTRGTAVAGLVTVTYNGGTHFTPGATVTILATPDATATAAGITASGGTATVPSTWDANGLRFTGAISTTTQASAASSTYTVDVSVSGPGSGPASVGGVYTVSNPYTVTVNCTAVVTNTPPTVDAGGPYTGNEGANVSIAGTASDVDNDPLTYAWTYAVDSADSGTTCSFGDATALSTTVNCTDNGTFTLTLTATGDPDGPLSDTASLTLSNVAPTVSLDSLGGTGGAACIGGNEVSIDFSWTDPASNDTFSYDVNWGDATTHSTGSSATSPVSGLTHTYAAGASYTITVQVTDDNSGMGSGTSDPFSFLYDATGVLQPVNDTQAGQDPSVFKYGSTIPVKIQVTDCNGTPVPNLTNVKVTINKQTSSTPTYGDDETITNTNSPDSGGYMRWSDPIYIYNLATKSLADSTATYKITITGPIATVTAYFGTRAK